ncbi:hypothetical protein GCM10011389_35640 [Pontibacillus salipaludis]|uniref:Uncharacterized protein n=1 Tax=Pontibacillus salipaludis TaxID=1697394 RepID=A0ABQ1QF92_9BACI|nr:hypothetical protein GCM10011389_35640 [Pontibacillus salipaludis]
MVTIPMALLMFSVNFVPYKPPYMEDSKLRHFYVDKGPLRLWSVWGVWGNCETPAAVGA